MQVQRWVAVVVVALVAATSFAVGWAVRGTPDDGGERAADAPATTATSTTTSTTEARVDDERPEPTEDTDEPSDDAFGEDEADGTAPADDPSALTHVLTVHTDGCGVIRTRTDPEPDNLTWRVLDEDGFSVLGRNALGETRYRYFRSGTYTVTLTAWGGGSYVPVSNTVTITC